MLNGPVAVTWLFQKQAATVKRTLPHTSAKSCCRESGFYCRFYVAQVIRDRFSICSNTIKGSVAICSSRADNDTTVSEESAVQEVAAFTEVRHVVLLGSVVASSGDVV